MQLIESAARWAWETSLAASVLILLALVVQLVGRKPIFTPVRHLVGLLVLARLLFPVSFESPLSIFNVLRAEPPVVAPVNIAHANANATVDAIQIGPATTPGPIPNHKFSITSYQWLSMAWLLGAIILLGRVFWQHAKVSRWVKNSAALTVGPAYDALVSAQNICGLHRPVAVHSVAEISTPALFGFLRPKILLPSALAQSGDISVLRLICLHELAHLSRFDVLINWAMIFAKALHWFNPLVWLALRRLSAEQELICDGDVMRHLAPGEYHSYGETLLALASATRPVAPSVLPISGSFKEMKERIAVIRQFRPAPHRLLMAALPVPAAILALLTFTAAVGKTAEKRPAAPAPKLTTPGAFEKELDQLRSELDKITDRVEAMRKTAEDMRDQLIGAGPLPPEERVIESETIRNLLKDRLRAEQEYVQIKRLQEGLKAIPRGKLRQTIPTAYRDEALDRLLNDLSKSEQQQVVMRKDYSDDHPEVVRLVALIAEVNKQIEARIDGILSGLETLVDSRKAVLESLSKQIAESERQESELSRSLRPYFKLKRDLETEQKLHDALYMRLLQETVDGKLRQTEVGKPKDNAF